MSRFLVLLSALAAVSALPAQDPVIRRLVPDGLRYNYAEAEDGTLHLVDSWVKVSDLVRSARFNPDTDIQYHLFTSYLEAEDGTLHLVDSWVKVSDLVRSARFYPDTDIQYHLCTRSNPTQSQPIVSGNAPMVSQSNFVASKRTVVLIHGFLGSGTAGSNQVLVPAFLAGEDVNVIVVDWSRGAHWGLNGIPAGRAIARFINWLNSATGATASRYHILGFSVGGHTAGIVARHVTGNVAYVTGLDPASRWEIDELVSPRDANYVEIIHTSAGVNGWGSPLGHTDFYPNGGRTMPGCYLSVICDHQRSYEYMAESVRTGGFMGWECRTHTEASIGSCNLPGRLRMGGLAPKPGARGIYFLRTNRSTPFSQG